MSDAIVIKTVLALTTGLPEECELTIVAEVFEPRNRNIVRGIAPGRVSVIDAQEILAKIMVQTSRTSGLSVVYSELLSFSGCELYFHPLGREGVKFGQLQFHFEDGVPIGVRRSDGILNVRTSSDYVLQSDDEILIIANDDSSIIFQEKPVITPKAFPDTMSRTQPRVERMLLLGWGPKAPIIIGEYADYVPEGSEVDVMLTGAMPEVVQSIGDLDAAYDSIAVRHVDKNPLSISDLESLEPFSYDTIIILPQKPRQGLDPEVADAETLISLLHLRECRPENSERETRLITEVLISNNQDLVSEVGVNDFIVSNRMVSMLFAQISEEPDIQTVYDDLFEEDGSEIYVKPARLYFDSFPVECRFGDVMQHVRKRGEEICIGYKRQASAYEPDSNFGVSLIPDKNLAITLGPDDGLVVLAEDDT